jgi:LacI family transcriptional regulator
MAIQGIPLVLMDRYYPSISVNHVILDNYTATYNAVNCFVSKEYKRIALIAYKAELVHMQERIRGYQEAMQLNGLKNEILVKRVRYENVFSDINKEMTELINSNKIEAILFATNALSITGLYFIRNNGIKIPKDIAIIGFDGHEVFDFYQPQLTYIQQPLEEMGKESTKILVEQINGSKKIVRVELKHQLIERGSCG